jgi:hypothetical protein
MSRNITPRGQLIAEASNANTSDSQLMTFPRGAGCPPRAAAVAMIAFFRHRAKHWPLQWRLLAS